MKVALKRAKKFDDKNKIANEQQLFNQEHDIIFNEVQSKTPSIEQEIILLDKLYKKTRDKLIEDKKVSSIQFKPMSNLDIYKFLNERLKREL